MNLYRHVRARLESLDIWDGPLCDVRTRLLEGAQVQQGGDDLVEPVEMLF